MTGRPTAAQAHELEALARLAAGRDCLDAVVGGRWPASPGLTAGIVRLVAAGHRRLVWADAARKAAA